jgi:hypothetical protein
MHNEFQIDQLYSLEIKDILQNNIYDIKRQVIVIYTLSIHAYMYCYEIGKRWYTT